MKVLLCSPYEPKFKDNGGGIVKWAKNLMGYYKKNREGVDVEVLPFDRSIYVHDNLNVLVRMYNGIKDYLALIRKTYNRIKEEKFDVLHLCSSAQWSIIRDYLVMKIARQKNVAGIVHFHCGRIPKIASDGGLKWRILKKVVAMSSATIVLDDESYRVLTSLGYDNVYKVPNPISIELGEEIACVSNKTSRVSRRVLFVGHVLPSKGVYELVRACAGIENIELRIVGRIEEKVKAELSAMAGDWLLLLGEKTHEEVLCEMLSCELFVLPSYTEGFPNVIIEAMACGTPIIATGVGAIPEILECAGGAKAGLIVPVRDVNSLRDAISELIDDETVKKDLSFNAVEKVNACYGVPIVWKRLVDVWEKAASRRINEGKRC